MEIVGNFRFTGSVEVPGDKSITHRAIIFAALAKGESRIRTPLLGRDNFASLRIVRELGVAVWGSVRAELAQIAAEEGFADFAISNGDYNEIFILGRGIESLTKPTQELNCGNSGTTARLMCGVLAACPFSAVLIGDTSLSKRPFKRVTDPLSSMGAQFSSEKMPLEVRGRVQLKAISYEMPKASAQVKSAIILAGLRADGDVSVIEPSRSRDHTERMLTSMGCVIEEYEESGKWKVVLPYAKRVDSLKPLDVVIPGDFSSAAFLMVAASVLPNSSVVIRNVGFNRTRIGLYELLIRMGADIEILNSRNIGGEDVVDLKVQSSSLKGIEVTPEDVVLSIDEIPVLSLACAFADGESVVNGASELRVKESDRISMIVNLLSGFGFEILELEDGFKLKGTKGEFPKSLNPQDETWQNCGDHRILMCGAILNLMKTGSLEVFDNLAIETSFPGFVKCFQSIIS